MGRSRPAAFLQDNCYCKCQLKHFCQDFQFLKVPSMNWTTHHQFKLTDCARLQLPLAFQLYQTCRCRKVCLHGERGEKTGKEGNVQYSLPPSRFVFCLFVFLVHGIHPNIPIIPKHVSICSMFLIFLWSEFDDSFGSGACAHVHALSSWSNVIRRPERVKSGREQQFALAGKDLLRKRQCCNQNFEICDIRTWHGNTVIPIPHKVPHHWTPSWVCSAVGVWANGPTGHPGSERLGCRASPHRHHCWTRPCQAAVSCTPLTPLTIKSVWNVEQEQRFKLLNLYSIISPYLLSSLSRTPLPEHQTHWRSAVVIAVEGCSWRVQPRRQS